MFNRTFIAASAAMLVSASALATTVTSVSIPADATTWSYVSPTKQAKQTHILGVYSSGNTPQGSSKVNVHVNGATKKPVTIVVSAYEPTTWVFSGNGRASIDTVIVNGYNHSKLVGLPFYTKVVDRTGFNARTGLEYYYAACAIEWPNDTRGCDTPALVKGVEAYTKTPISSFTGNDYYITDFTLNLSN